MTAEPRPEDVAEALRAGRPPSELLGDEPAPPDGPDPGPAAADPHHPAS